MRIIAGIYKSRKIATIEGLDTRPTTDKIRGAVFNIIGPYFDGEVILDLFAGSGALSLESISRGASYAYLIDKSYKAIKTINTNIANLGCKDKTKIFNDDALSFIKNTNLKFDIIFLDPPYKLNIIDEIINQVIERNLLNTGGIIVCEYSQGNNIKLKYDYLEEIKTKSYGITNITIFEKR